MTTFSTHMNTENGLNAMANMLPHLTSILNDPEYKALRERAVKSGAKLVDILPDSFSLIAQKHRADLYGVVSAVTGKSVDEVRQQPLEETMGVFQGATGKDVLDFFTFCAVMAARM